MNTTPSLSIVDQLRNHSSFGSYAAIGALVGQTREAVRKWKVVPAEFCRVIEKHTGGDFTRYDMRPDVFGADATDLDSAA